MSEVCVQTNTYTLVSSSFPVVFDDCKGNDKLNFEVSNPDFKMEPNGSLVALKNITEAGRALFIHARSAQAEDMAEVVIVGGKDNHGSLKVIKDQSSQENVKEGCRFNVTNILNTRQLYLLKRDVIRHKNSHTGPDQWSI